MWNHKGNTVAVGLLDFLSHQQLLSAVPGPKMGRLVSVSQQFHILYWKNVVLFMCSWQYLQSFDIIRIQQVAAL